MDKIDSFGEFCRRMRVPKGLKTQLMRRAHEQIVQESTVIDSVRWLTVFAFPPHLTVAFEKHVRCENLRLVPVLAVLRTLPGGQEIFM